MIIVKKNYKLIRLPGYAPGPAARTHKHQKFKNSNQHQSTKMDSIELALADLASQDQPNYSATARKYYIEPYHAVPPPPGPSGTLSGRRALGTSEG